jgi:hypothetical protein
MSISTESITKIPAVGHDPQVQDAECNVHGTDTYLLLAVSIVSGT